jgi:hypothetical protein
LLYVRALGVGLMGVVKKWPLKGKLVKIALIAAELLKKQIDNF